MTKHLSKDTLSHTKIVRQPNLQATSCQLHIKIMTHYQTSRKNSTLTKLILFLTSLLIANNKSQSITAGFGSPLQKTKQTIKQPNYHAMQVRPKVFIKIKIKEMPALKMKVWIQKIGLERDVILVKSHSNRNAVILRSRKFLRSATLKGKSN